MPLTLVQKFGGTSVGSPERIRAVARRVAESHRLGHRLVVVVSAMGRTTDELIELAHQVSANPPHREMDMLLTTGERISMALLSMALSELGVSALSFTGSQTGIITDSSHRRARIQRILGDRVKAALAENRVAIVAGFQGVSESKEITTLGRGGSDTTAVALAAFLGAEMCEIFTDVDGVYTADPRLVSEARLWNEIPAPLMLELALRGAGVLHPRSVEMACQSGVKLVVRNCLNQSEGTQVIQKKGLEEFSIAGITADRGQLFLTVEFASIGLLAETLKSSARGHLPLLAASIQGLQLTGFVDQEMRAEWEAGLEVRRASGGVKSFSMDEKTAPISVIGNRFSQDCSALSEVIEVLARSGVSVRMASVSALAMTVGVPNDRADEAVRILHSQFFPGE